MKHKFRKVSLVEGNDYPGSRAFWEEYCSGHNKKNGNNQKVTKGYFLTEEDITDYKLIIESNYCLRKAIKDLEKRLDTIEESLKYLSNPPFDGCVKSVALDALGKLK